MGMLLQIYGTSLEFFVFFIFSNYFGVNFPFEVSTSEMTHIVSGGAFAHSAVLSLKPFRLL